MVDEQQQAVDDPAQLVVLAVVVARTREGVELVKEQDARLLAGELEYLADIAGRLTEIG